MSKNLYAEVLKELQKDQNWRALVFEIAGNAPSGVLKAIYALQEEMQND